jgi:hypothetical protein
MRERLPTRRPGLAVPFGDAMLAVASVAGRGVGSAWSHRVTWACVGCLIPDHADRAIALRELVAVPQKTIPAWELFADIGS